MPTLQVCTVRDILPVWGVQVVAKVNETLPAQTAEIKSAVASLNLAKELAIALPKVEEASFDVLVAAVPVYIKAKSVDEHLLHPLNGGEEP